MIILIQGADYFSVFEIEKLSTPYYWFTFTLVINVQFHTMTSRSLRTYRYYSKPCRQKPLENLEDTEGVIIRRNLKDRQYNNQKTEKGETMMCKTQKTKD
jgi:hypothetical protein